MITKSRTIELSVAVASFLAAVAFAFTSLLIADNHEVAAGNCAVIAQFLLLTASIFGIDYQFNRHDHKATTRNPQQQSPQHP